METAVYILNIAQDPYKLTTEQRYSYLTVPDLKQMKIVLAYL